MKPLVPDREAWKTWPLPEPGTSLRKWQAGRCAWCGGDSFPYRLCEDHCHNTGLIRGLLCRSCNTREGSSWNGDWDGWRNGDHPAAALKLAEVYVSSFGGTTSLYPSAALTYYTAAEQDAWWEKVTADVAAGGVWPVDAPWTPEATARKSDDWEKAKAAMQSLLDRAGITEWGSGGAA